MDDSPREGAQPQQQAAARDNRAPQSAHEADAPRLEPRPPPAAPPITDWASI